MKPEFIPYSTQSLSADDRKAVQQVLYSSHLTQGREVDKFERKLCALTGARYAVALSSGTAALDLAVQALELPENSLGLTSPNSFAASSNAMLYHRIRPFFIDIDRTMNLDLSLLEQALNQHRSEVSLLLPVHFAGNAIDMPRLKQIAGSLPIIEDAAHAIGSHYPSGAPVGSCKYSDMTVFSFHPVKTITTGEGGAVTTNCPELHKKLQTLRSHGITREPADWLGSGQTEGSEPPPWYYQMQRLGRNYRLTDLQAALGTSQCSQLETFRYQRSKLAEVYDLELKDLPWLTTPITQRHACLHLYVVRIRFAELPFTRTQVMNFLRKRGIGTQVHYIPIPTQPYYRELGYGMQTLPQCRKYYEEALSIPLFPGMSEKDQQRVIQAFHELGAAIQRGGEPEL